MKNERWSPLTRLRIELMENHAEEVALSPFPETAKLDLSGDELMVAQYLIQVFGCGVPTDKAHVLIMFALAITILEEDNGYF